MSDIFREVDNCVTAPHGFRAGAIACGIKSDATIKDLAILASDVPCVAAGTFTTGSTRAAPVIVCQERLKSGKAQAVIVNSGNANCATGELGMQNAYSMTEFVARRFHLDEEWYFVPQLVSLAANFPSRKLRLEWQLSNWDQTRAILSLKQS